MAKKINLRQILVIVAAIGILLLNRAGIINLPQNNQATEAPPTEQTLQAERVTPTQKATATPKPTDDPNTYWGNASTLQDHFKRHGSDFKAKDADDYARKAHAMYLARDQYQVKIDDEGTIRVYDAKTRAFGAYNRDGTTKTFFKPSDGQDYFDRQPGK